MDRGKWKRLIALLFGGWLAIWVYRSMLTPVYEEIKADIGMQSNAAMGLIASLYFLGYTVMQVPSGLLVRKWGQKRVIIPGFILLAAGTLVTAAAGTIHVIYIGSLLAGIGCGTFYGAAFSLTAEYVPKNKKGLSAAMVNSGCSVGLLAGFLGSTLLVKRWAAPWRIMGVISFMMTVIMAVLFLVFVKDGSGDEAKQPEDAGRSQPPGRLLNARLISCSILYFATCYVYYLIITWLPDYLETERGLRGGVLGIVSALICVTAVPGGLYFAWLSDLWPRRKRLIVVFLELASVLIVIAAMMAPGLKLLIVMLLLYGFFGKISVDPVLISCISDFSGQHSLALVLGIFNCCGMSGSIIAPILTGYIKDVSGSGSWGFYIGAALLAVGTVCFVWMDRDAN